jgi:hypothetical protein
MPTSDDLFQLLLTASKYYWCPVSGAIVIGLLKLIEGQKKRSKPTFKFHFGIYLSILLTSVLVAVSLAWIDEHKQLDLRELQSKTADLLLEYRHEGLQLIIFCPSLPEKAVKIYEQEVATALREIMGASYAERFYDEIGLSDIPDLGCSWGRVVEIHRKTIQGFIDALRQPVWTGKINRDALEKILKKRSGLKLNR